MLVKEYVRIDHADGKRKFNVVLDNVSFFAEYYPPKEKKPDVNSTVVAFNNGTVMHLDVPIAQFRQAIASYKK